MTGKELGQSKNDYGNNAASIYGSFLGPNLKFCIFINEFGLLDQTVTL